MSGYLLLEGGSEFGGKMSDPDAAALQLAGESACSVRIIPTAAALDQNHARVGRIAEAWFRRLGATDVAWVPILDRASAMDQTLADQIRAAQLIYLPGGFPAYTAQALVGSRVAEAIKAAFDQGAIIAGSSAGAMVLCEWCYDPRQSQLVAGLGMLPGSCFLPHHNSYGATWAPELQQKLPAATLIGVDEETGMLGRPGAEWRLLGKGAATIYQKGVQKRVVAGEIFQI